MNTEVKKEPGQNSRVPRSTRKRTQATLSNFDVKNLSFPSRTDTLFRMSHKLTDDGQSVIWLEDKSTHQQWQSTFQDVSKQGPEGVKIPADVIITNLSSATQAQSNVATPIQVGAVDLEEDVDGAVQLVFTMEMTQSWSPQYCFTLLPVEVSAIELLKAQLNDTKEELAKISKKQPLVPHYCSIGSQSVFQAKSNIVWDAHTRKHLNATHFKLSPSNNLVTVLQKGTYHIQAMVGSDIYLTVPNSISLRVNDIAVATWTQASIPNHGNEYQSLLVSDICELKANDKVGVFWDGEDNALCATDAARTRLIIQKL